MEGALFPQDEIWSIVMYYFHNNFGLQMLVSGFIVSFILSFAVGANDSANSWGTSVGAGTISLGWVYFLGSIMETIGATLLSGDVIKKVVNGIVNMDAYRSNKTAIIANWTSEMNSVDWDGQLQAENLLYDEKLLVIGCMSVMLGSGIWQLIASFFCWPVAGTHCIIFGLLGFTITAKGTDGIKNGSEVGQIVYMLLVSVLVALVGTALLYYPLYKYCIRSKSPFVGKNRVVFATLTGFSIGIPVAFILFQTNKVLHIFRDVFTEPGWESLLIIGIGFAVSLVVSVLAFTILLPSLKTMTGSFALQFDIKDWIESKRRERFPVQKTSTDVKLDQIKVCENANNIESNLNHVDHNSAPELKCLHDSNNFEKPVPAPVQIPVEENCVPESGSHGADPKPGCHEEDPPEIVRIFRPLQIISAMTSALVHGGNDVANCIGPFVVINLVFQQGVVSSSTSSSPWYISLWGGAGISLGLILYGKKVIMTLGTGISEMTPSRGFSVEWVASLVGLIFTASGLMISTTHCKVGGVIGAGLMQGLVETGSFKEAVKYVNFKVLSGVLLAWVLTIPAAFGLTSLVFLILKAILLS